METFFFFNIKSQKVSLTVSLMVCSKSENSYDQQFDCSIAYTFSKRMLVRCVTKKVLLKDSELNKNSLKVNVV